MPSAPDENGERLSRFLDSLPLGVYVCGLDGRVILWNEAAERMTGHRAADAIGRPCGDLLRHVDAAGRPLCGEAGCPIHRAAHLGEQVREPILARARTADGRQVTVTISCSPWRDAAGKIVGAVEVFRDETDRLADLEISRDLLRRLMPRDLPVIPGLRLSVRWLPAGVIGGDFYDVRPVGEAGCGVLAGDVSGHGVSAALYVTLLLALVERHQDLVSAPGPYLTGLNREAAQQFAEGHFATSVFLYVNGRQGIVLHANAGHPPPLHYDAARRRITPLTSSGLALGFEPNEQYASEELHFGPGDAILCYSDGVTEARVGVAPLRVLGQEGLIGLLEEVLPELEEQPLDRLLTKLRFLCVDRVFDDDLLLLLIQRTG